MAKQLGERDGQISVKKSPKGLCVVMENLHREERSNRAVCRLIAEARRNPRIARYQDEERQGMLLLHLVRALKPPFPVVNEILRIIPRAVSHKSIPGGLLPLHIAVGRNADVHVVRLLIQQDIKFLLTPDSNGHKALAWVCRKDVSKDLVRLILEFNPSLAHQQTGKLGSPLEFVYRQRHFYQTTPANELSEWDENQWMKLTYLLGAAHYGTVVTYRNGHKFSTLHAALALSGPTHIIEDASRIYAEDVYGIRDYQGNYPLHYAARTYNSSRRVLVQHLKHFPPAAASIRDSQGGLTMHKALKQGQTWEEGIKDLYRAHPAAIAEKDVEVSLFPDM